MRIGIIGFGRMGGAIGTALSATALGNAAVCTDSNHANVEAAKRLGFVAADSAAEVAQKCDCIIVCVKPKDLKMVLAEIRPFAKGKMVVSIAAGKKIGWMEGELGLGSRIVRVMPNIAALAGASVNVYTCKNVSESEKKEVVELLEVFGKPVEMDERGFDAVTGLSGSGPAFAAYFIESLAEAGVENGIPEGEAHALALETVYGTAKLMRDKDFSAAQVIEMVSSPNGTTVAGRRVLEAGEFRKIVRGTVDAARKRSEELDKDG